MSDIQTAWIRYQLSVHVDGIQKELKSRKKVTSETVAKVDRLVSLADGLLDEPRSSGID